MNGWFFSTKISVGNETAYLLLGCSKTPDIEFSEQYIQEADSLSPSCPRQLTEPAFHLPVWETQTWWGTMQWLGPSLPEVLPSDLTMWPVPCSSYKWKHSSWLCIYQDRIENKTGIICVRKKKCHSGSPSFSSKPPPPAPSFSVPAPLLPNIVSSFGGKTESRPKPSTVILCLALLSSSVNIDQSCSVPKEVERAVAAQVKKTCQGQKHQSADWDSLETSKKRSRRDGKTTLG